MKFLWFILAVVALGMAGLYGWYGSLHPCDMLLKDSLRASAAGGAGLDSVFRSLIAPVKMTPGQCVQALAKLHLSPNDFVVATETKPDRVATKEHKHATKKALSKTEKLRALEKSYQDLLNPSTKDDAQEGEPGYNSRMREEMRRAIEGVTGSARKTILSEEIAMVRAIQDQLRRCWRIDPYAQGNQDIVVEIRVLLNPDGSVKTAEILDAVRMVQDGNFRIAAENAKRAVKQCSPFQLPPHKYGVWRKLTLRFDPRRLFSNKP